MRQVVVAPITPPPDPTIMMGPAHVTPESILHTDKGLVTANNAILVMSD